MVQRVRSAMAMVAALFVAAPAAAQAVQGSSWAAPAGEDMLPDEIAWHVRAGLNVAALACRDRDAAMMVERYNRMLANHRVPLAAARAGVEAHLRDRFGAAWQAHDDDAMTRLYNHFAAPGAHDAFCTAARDVLRDSEGVAPAEFPAFALHALPQLEQAFALEGSAVAPTGERSLVAQARSLLAARDDMPRIALATNARVPLAPPDNQRRDAAPTAEAVTAMEPATAAAPGFSSSRP